MAGFSFATASSTSSLPSRFLYPPPTTFSPNPAASASPFAPSTFVEPSSSIPLAAFAFPSSTTSSTAPLPISGFRPIGASIAAGPTSQSPTVSGLPALPPPWHLPLDPALRLRPPVQPGENLPAQSSRVAVHLLHLRCPPLQLSRNRWPQFPVPLLRLRFPQVQPWGNRFPQLPVAVLHFLLIFCLLVHHQAPLLASL